MSNEVKSMDVFGNGLRKIPEDLVLVMLGASDKKVEAAHTILGMFPEFRIMSESDLDYAIQQLSLRRESTRQKLDTRCVLVIRQIIQRQQKKGIPTIICLDFYSDVLDLARDADFNDHVLFVNLYDSTLGFINIDAERKTSSQIAVDVQKEINKYLS